MSTSSPKRLWSDRPLYQKNKYVWSMRGSDKKMGLEKLENWSKYQLFRDGGNLKTHGHYQRWIAACSFT